VNTLLEYAPLLLDGTLLTLGVSLTSLLLAVVLGLLGAVSRLSKNPLLSAPAALYTTVTRGIPDLVLMLLLFYGGQMLVNDLAYRLGYEGYIEVDAFTAGVLTIGFIFGAYMTETFRGAILAVGTGQPEAAAALGLSQRQTFVLVIVPQMIRHALPGFTNNWLILLKTTALVSVIGLPDVVRRGAQAAGTTREPFTFYFAVCVVYLILTSLTQWALNYVERRATFLTHH
jgi:His/Glu/Gln/Arg/opine family amino acid ABC transporter permease subunit